MVSDPIHTVNRPWPVAALSEAFDVKVGFPIEVMLGRRGFVVLKCLIVATIATIAIVLSPIGAITTV
jgi:hypothetical protein